MSDQAESTAPDVVEWRPGRTAALVMTGLGLARAGGTFLALVSLRAVVDPAFGSVTLAGGQLLIGLLVLIAVTTVLTVIHELIHGLAVAAYGGTPTYGVTTIAKVLPAFYTTCRGHLFTRAQFAVVGLAPFVGLNLALAAGVGWLAYGAWLILPAAFHAAGCGGDLVIVWQAMRQPPGTRIEDRKDGVAFHRADGGRRG